MWQDSSVAVRDEFGHDADGDLGHRSRTDRETNRRSHPGKHFRRNSLRQQVVENEPRLPLTADHADVTRLGGGEMIEGFLVVAMHWGVCSSWPHGENQRMRTAMTATLERVMQAEIELFLGERAEAGNKRNGYVTRTYGIKGVGQVRVRVPRDRLGRFTSAVVPARRRYDEATERDLALLHLAGLSTRMLARVSGPVLGVTVSPQEVSESIDRIVPAAKRFLNRPLGGRKWIYLYVDGTNFHVRRTTVDRAPTLVVVGVDEHGRKSVLAMVQLSLIHI